MKKTLAFLITVVLLLCTIGSIHVLAAPVMPDISGGYYQIKTKNHFEWFVDAVNGGEIELTANAVLCNDIDISGVGSFSGRSTLIGSYRGIFDGQGFAIKGLSLVSVNTDGKKQSGLFGVLEGATIKNLTIEGAITDNASATPTYIGGLAARAKGNTVISNVAVNVNITEDGAAGHVGGIVGSTQDLGQTLTIEKCLYNGTMTVQSTNDCIGGILGYANENTYIENCGSVGSINNNSSSAKVGGILGYINNGDFKKLSGCYSDMSLTTALDNEYVGSIIGRRRATGGAVIERNVGTSTGGMDIYGGYTETASDDYMRISNWTNSDYAKYLNDNVVSDSSTWVQSLGINGGYPILRSMLPSCGIVLVCTDGVLPNYKYDENGTLTLLDGGAYTLRMRSDVASTSDSLIINSPADVTLTLNNVDIDCSSSGTSAIRIERNTGNVTMVLSGTNTLKGGENCSAIDSTAPNLTIEGTGSLTATGGWNGSGILGNYSRDCSITINGGTITATGGQFGAGIGAHAITINDGTITAKGGVNGAGIGGAEHCTPESITINGGTITAKGTSYGAGIGGSQANSGGTITISGGTVTADGGLYGGAGIGGGHMSSKGTFSTGVGGNAFIVASSISDQGYKTNPATGGIIVENGNTVVGGDQTLTADFTIASEENMTITEGSSLTVPEDVTLTNNGIIFKVGELIVNGTLTGTGTITEGLPTPYLDEGGAEQICEVYKNLTGAYLEANGNTLAAGWYVVKGTVTATNRITVNGNVHIILTNGSTLNAENGGIDVSSGKSLSVYAQTTDITMGALVATGTAYNAGIGGAQSKTSGTITINGGNVTANGGQYAAGIGGGDEGSGMNITVNGGNVTATGGANGAGIGGGYEGVGDGIAITGGSVTATGGFAAAGIGGGRYGNGGAITVSGGIVTASGNSEGAGIGGGINGSGGTFSTGVDGNAYIVASSIADQSYKTNSATGGIIIDNGNTVVGGDQTLTADFTIESGKNMTITEGSSLTVPEDVTLTNNGIILKLGELIVNGMLVSPGAITEGLPTPYLDEGGTEQVRDIYKYITAEYLEANGNTLPSGWYVVKGTVTTTNRITVNGNVHIILTNGSTLNAENGGIGVLSGNSLTVYAQTTDATMGTLIATGTAYKAGIGGGQSINGGTITVNGGNVTATGGDYAAGIGGGNGSHGGTITVNGGVVTATGGDFAAGIGGGNLGSGGTVTISGGVVTANGGQYGGAGIGGGASGSGGTFSTGVGGNAVIVASFISDQSYKTNENTSGIIIEGNEGAVYGNLTLTASCTFESGMTVTIPVGRMLTVADGVTLTNNGILLSYGTLVNNGTIDGSGLIVTGLPISYLDGDGTEKERKIYIELTAEYLAANSDTLPSGWYAVTGEVNATNRIIVSGDVHIILKDDCTLTAAKGIRVNEGNSLSIYVQSTGEAIGELIATGGECEAGIGGGNEEAGGTITICGGKITATGGKWSAGIGGGSVGNGGAITIHGGDITANGGLYGGAGIGCGSNGSGGAVTINGGNVTAMGGDYGAGIGGGDNSSGGTITINGGTVTANGGLYGGAGIGGGSGGSGGTVTVNGGTVTATGGDDGAGIGGGDEGDGGTITINGGDIAAISDYGAGIGSGYSSGDDAFTDAGTIIISGGNITATSNSGAGIGGGFKGTGGDITISGGNITAQCTSNGSAGIGGGHWASCGTITVNGGDITATGGKNASGIGDGGDSSGGGVITISGGVVTANGGEFGGAGIGGGNRGGAATIIISGGIVTANSEYGTTGIGDGADSTGGSTFSTGENGDAVIVTDSISDQGYKTNENTSGIIVEGNDGVVYGDQTLTEDLTLESGKTLTVPEGSTLNVADGSTLSIEDGAAIANNGTVNIDGTLALPEGTEVDEALLGGFTGSGVITAGEETYPLPKDVFADISATLGEDISLTYYITKGDFETAPRMRFTVNGYTVLVNGVADGDTHYAYKFTGIAPQWMGDTITAELLGEDDAVIATKEYSVVTYLNTLGAMSAEALGYTPEKYNALQTLISDLLVYGGAAQTFTNYKTEALVSDGVTGSEFVTLVNTDKGIADNGTYATFKSATVYFNNINKMKIRFSAESIEGLVLKFKIGDGEEQVLEYVSDGEGSYVITTPGIFASDYDNVYTFTAYKDSVAGATLTYSVKSYVYAMQDSANTAMASLAQATYNYGISAKAFADAG